jgi:hypothetical protein
METQPDVKSLCIRVERLEKQNRRMKRTGVVAILSAVVLLVSGQAKVDNKKTIEANEFVLKDENGAVRAKLGMGFVFPLKDAPGLVLYNEGGHERAAVAASEEQALIRLSSSGSITSSTSSSMWAGVPGKDGSGVGVTGPSGVIRMNLDGVVYSGPQIGLQDKEGYETQIGKTDLVVTKTGKTEQTSAASVVMFNKEKKVLWSAP